MKRSLFVVFVLFFTVSVFAKEKIPEPVWANKTQLEKAFPSRIYMAQIGESNKAEDAKAAAIMNLSVRFKADIDSSFGTEYSADSVVNGKSKARRKNSRNVTVSTENTLNALETTEPYYRKSEKKWICVAFFKRDDALEAFKPELEIEKRKFDLLFKKAEKENDPILKMRIYETARNKSDAFFDKLEYANLLAPELVQSTYAEDIDNIASIDNFITDIKIKNPLCVKVENDSANLIRGALLQIFAEFGFTVVDDEQFASYIAYCKVDDNDAPVQLGTVTKHFLRPGFSLRIAGKNGPVYACNGKIDEASSAYDIEKAKNAALSKLADYIKITTAQDFEAYMIGNK